VIDRYSKVEGCMRLQIAFHQALDKALAIAEQVADYADIIEVGSLILYQHGIHAVHAFREKFPQKTLLIDTKIINRGKDVMQIFASANPDWLTVMAGTQKHIIHAAANAGHSHKIKVMLDLLDSSSIGQAALEAESQHVDALLFHQPSSEQDSFEFINNWEMVRGNTKLPIFVAAQANRNTIDKILDLKPDGLILGSTITQADNPVEEAKFYYNLCHNK